MPSNMGGLLTALLLVSIGILNCFYGYKLFRIVLGTWGFVSGVAIALFLVASGDPAVAIIAAIVGGIIGIGLMLLLYSFGVFLMGAVFGAALSATALSILGSEPNILVAIVVALVMGFVALRVDKLFVMVATASSGAAGIIIGGLLFIPGSDISLRSPDALREMIGGSPMILVVWAVLALAGFVFQMRRDNTLSSDN